MGAFIISEERDWQASRYLVFWIWTFWGRFGQFRIFRVIAIFWGDCRILILVISVDSVSHLWIMVDLMVFYVRIRVYFFWGWMAFCDLFIIIWVFIFAILGVTDVVGVTNMYFFRRWLYFLIFWVEWVYFYFLILAY